MGDVIHALPVLGALRRSYPDARIDWVIEHQWQELVELHPGLTNVIPVDTRTWRRSLSETQTWRAMVDVVRGLRDAGYDIALDLQGLYKSSLLARLSGAERRIGFDSYSLREPGAAMFYTEQVVVGSGPGNEVRNHVVDKNLALAMAAGASLSDAACFNLPVTSDDEREVQQQLSAKGVKDFFVVSPGGGWGAKRWPVDRYVEFARKITEERGWHCFLNTGPGEKELTAEFERSARGFPWIRFPLSVRELAALLKRARLVVAGDTGPLHMAAALGTRLVGLYGPTDPTRNGPYKTSSRGNGLLRLIHHSEMKIRSYRRENTISPAMLAITVDEVKAAADGLLENSRG